MGTPIQFDLLHLFTVNGHTFTFKRGTITVDNETMLCFHYMAASDGNTKHGVFQKANLAGYSVGITEAPKDVVNVVNVVSR